MKRILASILLLTTVVTPLFSLPLREGRGGSFSLPLREGRGGSLAGVCLVFNEVMQSNVDYLMVENNFPDSWAEIYNPGSAAVNVSGWRIGITNSFDASYPLPSAEVPAGGHLVVYCDKEARGLHTNFRIDSGKGSLYLFSADGTIVDSLIMKKMPAPNIAYGRTTDGAEDWHYEFTPTAGEPNAGGGAQTVLPTPVFNIEGGIYEGYHLITISRPEGLDNDVAVFFTIDGSEPTRSSRANYVVNISLGETKIVRARLISLSGAALPSPVVTQSYIYRERENNLPVISIVTDRKYLYDSKIGILASNVNDGTPNYMQKWRRPINIEYFQPNPLPLREGWGGSLGGSFLAETAVSGVSTREEPQKSLKVYTNKRFGNKTFQGTFWGDKPNVTKVKSFVLRNGGNNASGSRINDAVVQRLFGTHVDNLDWQAYQPVVVYLNGEYFGEYGMRERSDEDYVEANYGIEDVELADEISYQSPEKGTLFYEFYKSYTSKTTTYEEMETLMDVDNFIKTMAAEVYGMNTDFPTNNVSMWCPLTQPNSLPLREGWGGSQAGEGLWRWILKDMDRFGMSLPLYPQSFNMVSYLFSPDNLMYGGLHHFDLYKKMISFPEVRNRFVDVLQVALGDFLKPQLVTELIDSLADDIRDEVRATFSLYHQNFNDFTHNIEYLKRTATQRPAYLYSQLAEYFKLGSVIPLRVNTAGTSVRMNGMPLTEGDFDGSCFSDKSVVLEVVDPVTGQVLSDYSWRVTIDHPGSESVVHTYGGGRAELTPKSLGAAPGATITCEPFIADGIVELHDTQSSALLHPHPAYTLDGRRATSALRSVIISGNRKAFANQ